MRLRRSDLGRPGLSRRRSGRGCRFLGPDGTPVDGQDRQRIRALAIPPAWREVWICPWPNGHIQATGCDDAGRRQYLYHEQWRRRRDEEKFDRVVDLAPCLPEFREAVQTDLVSPGRTRRRVLAAAPVPHSKRGRRQAEAAMFRAVAEHLGNTPAVARKSYVDPRLVDRFEHGDTIAEFLDPDAGLDLADAPVRATVEQAVRELLR